MGWDGMGWDRQVDNPFYNPLCVFAVDTSAFLGFSTLLVCRWTFEIGSLSVLAVDTKWILSWDLP